MYNISIFGTSSDAGKSTISFAITYLLHKRGIKQDYGHFGFPAHIYGFDKKSLRKILKKSGYETIHFESWSNILTRGKVNIFNYIIVQLIKKFSLSDYIVCVARKL